jgi:hypothetical protein
MSDGVALARAIENGLISPNVSDSNFEPANVVDTLDAVAHGLERIAKAIEAHTAATTS